MGCKQFQVIQPWFDLSQNASCERFQDQDLDSVWFVKKSDTFGGVGMEVNYLRNFKNICPMKGHLAMKYDIQNILLVKQKKFDIRLYVFIYTDPLVVYINYGYLQMATESFEVGNFDKDTVHNTNPHVCSSIRPIKECLLPFDFLQGLKLVKGRIDQVVLFHLFSIPNLMERKERTFFKLGLDVALDKHMNPYVYDINTSPASRAGNQIPFVMKAWYYPWLQFLDIIQEIEIRRKLGKEIKVQKLGTEQSHLKLVYQEGDDIECYRKDNADLEL